MRRTSTTPAAQRGIALLTSMLLLLIITLMALAMFRSVGTQEKITGNLHEKDRAIHAALAAQQYGEWWLLQGSNVAVGPVNCVGSPVQTATSLNMAGQICLTSQTAVNTNPMFGGDITVPANWLVRTEYLPQGMSVTGAGVNNDIMYAKVPAFYIADLGLAADGAGEAYQVAAYGVGGSPTSIAVVESVYEVQQGVINRGGL
jgi:type IV pilus assembly protein PilX